MEDLIIVNEGKLELAQNAVNKIVEVENKIKELKELQESYKEQLLNTMEENDVVKIDIPELVITRKAPTTRESLDAKALKEELQDIYDSYVKISDVKGSITIKIK